MRRLTTILAGATAAVLCATAVAAERSAPRLGYVAASLQAIQGRYYVDAPADAYVVEVATAPAANGDGSFVAANVVDSLTGLHAARGVVDWTADRLLPPGTYYVHGGDVGSGGTAWSGVTRFMVVTACVIPNLRGRTLAASRAALAARGCGVGAVRRVHSTRRAGRVVRTDPPIGTHVPPQTPVRVFVSAGPRRARRP